jgi:hypothetical protein
MTHMMEIWKYTLNVTSRMTKSAKPSGTEMGSTLQTELKMLG